MAARDPNTTSGESDAVKASALVAIPPQPFGKYTLIGKLGHGGMAEVNLAVVEGKSNFRKLVVIKRLHRHLAMEPGFVDMFLDEARLAAKLNHPHCVQTNEVGEHDGNHFLAMEYLDGQGLERLLRVSGQKNLPIPPPIAARIVADALDGLAYAHELVDYDGSPLGVVHRDVSPQNLFVTYDGMVKLLDFGIAKAASHVVETRTGVIKGKYAYIAPEQALATEVDHRADLWSMGVVLWEVLTGRRLFKSINELATLNETLRGDIKLPSHYVPDLPAELDTICLRALQREIDQRYQSAQEMKDDLERWLSHLPSPPSRKHVARLMRDRFEGVTEAQRATLAQCLKGSAISTGAFKSLLEPPMLTPSGVHASGQQSVTPTPTPSAVVSAPPIAQPSRRGGWGWKVAILLTAIFIAGGAALVIPFRNRDRNREPGRIAHQSVPDQVERVPAPIERTAAIPTPTPVQHDPTPIAPPDAIPTPDPEPTPEPVVAVHEPHHRPVHHHEPTTHDTAPSAGSGFLTLVTTPWTQVRIGPRDLGTTPIVRAELPAGTHTLQLTNDEAGINTTYRVTIAPGETVTRRLGLP